MKTTTSDQDQRDEII